MELDKQFNLVIPIESLGGEAYQVYAPEPPTALVKSVLPILQKLYSLAAAGTTPDIIFKDFIFYAEELEREGKIKVAAVRNFLEKIEMISHVLTPSLEEIPFEQLKGQNDIDEEVIEQFEGMLLFILASSRYLSVAQKKNALKDFYTSLSFTDWVQQCRRLSKESEGEASSLNT